MMAYPCHPTISMKLLRPSCLVAGNRSQSSTMCIPGRRKSNNLNVCLKTRRFQWRTARNIVPRSLLCKDAWTSKLPNTKRENKSCQATWALLCQAHHPRLPRLQATTLDNKQCPFRPTRALSTRTWCPQRTKWCTITWKPNISGISREFD